MARRFRVALGFGLVDCVEIVVIRKEIIGWVLGVWHGEQSPQSLSLEDLSRIVANTKGIKDQRSAMLPFFASCWT